MLTINEGNVHINSHRSVIRIVFCAFLNVLIAATVRAELMRTNILYL